MSMKLVEGDRVEIAWLFHTKTRDIDVWVNDEIYCLTGQEAIAFAATAMEFGIILTDAYTWVEQVCHKTDGSWMEAYE